MDRLTPNRRSWLMSRVRSRDTIPERVVRSLAHRLGYRFRLHRRNLPGCPDLVFPSRHAIVFVHGCFWHQHPNCRKAGIPKSRKRFWLDKFARNVERDSVARKTLRKLGWRVLTIWACQVRDAERLSTRLTSFLDRTGVGTRKSK
ncbi:DNA mismatch endonuclease Vsr [Candidatus Sumerlaeota bacterium]|nr:DNA mismatch endonuclease Vsr [Candidatus Sumerlaeota bacterium]